MATLTAFRFDTVDGADNALGVISMLQEQELIAILDAALVSWPKGKTRPRTRQIVWPTRTQLLDGTFWGMLFGLIFFVPVLDTRRAETDRLTSALSDVGIDDTFIYQVRSRLTEGTSALFVLSPDAVMDRINDASKGRRKPDLIAINLPHDEEMKLRNLFGPASTPPPRAPISTS